MQIKMYSGQEVLAQIIMKKRWKLLNRCLKIQNMYLDGVDCVRLVVPMTMNHLMVGDANIFFLNCRKDCVENNINSKKYSGNTNAQITIL